jgi:voltage-gated potassium channel
MDLGHAELKNTLIRRTFWLLGVASLHVCLFYYFEDVAFLDAIWVTMVTISTVGYGDVSAETIGGKISTVVLCVLTGIAMLASVFDAYSSWREESRGLKRSGLYQWNLKGHILIANFPSSYSIAQMVRLIQAIRANAELTGKPIQILTRRFAGKSLPQDLVSLGGVSHVHGTPSQKKTLESASVSLASHLVILRKPEQNDPEGHSFNICARAAEMNPNLIITVQVDEPTSRASQRIHRAGATNILRQARAYPEILSMAMTTKGINDLFEDLLSIDGNELRLISYFGNLSWTHISERVQESGMGIALGIARSSLAPNGQYVSKPLLAPGKDFSGSVTGVYVLSRKRSGRSPSETEWLEVTSGLKETQTQETKTSRITLFNLPVRHTDPLIYLEGLIYQLRKTASFASADIVVVSNKIPEKVKTWAQTKVDDAEPGWDRIKLIDTSPSDYILGEFLGTMEERNLGAHEVAAVLSHDVDEDPDGYAFELTDLLRHECGFKGLIVAECYNDDERLRLYQAGANNCLRPVKAYPGMVARTLANPGAEKAIEALFRYQEIQVSRIEVADINRTSRSFIGNGRVSYQQFINLCLGRDSQSIALSVRQNGEHSERICPSLYAQVEVGKCSAMVLTRKA